MFNPKIIFETNSPFSGNIKVVESNGEYRLIIGGFTQSRSLKENGKSDGYWDAFTEFNLPKQGLKNILILGLGAGTMAKLITHKFGPVQITAVEIDPAIVEIAKTYFDLNEKNVHPVIEDAAKFLERAKEKYDLVCVDVFRHGEVPDHCEGESFYQNLAKVLNQDGVIIFNRIIHDEEKEKIQEYSDYLEKIFRQIEILTVPGAMKSSNVVFYGRGKR